MVKNVNQYFPKPKMTSANSLYRPQPKDIQFTVIEGQRNQKIFTFENLDIFTHKMIQNKQLIFEIAADQFNS